MFLIFATPLRTIMTNCKLIQNRVVCFVLIFLALTLINIKDILALNTKVFYK
jgi:hypothetical protein